MRIKLISFILICLPVFLHAQLSGIKKGKLAPEMDLNVAQYFKKTADKGPGEIAAMLNLTMTRTDENHTQFFFPFMPFTGTHKLLKFDLVTMSAGDFFSYRNNGMNLYQGEGLIVAMDSTIVIDGEKHTGASFVNLEDNKYIAHVLLTKDKDWRFISHTFFEFADENNARQIVFAAAFYNPVLHKQEIKGWRFQDLPVYESYAEIGKRIVKETFLKDSTPSKTNDNSAQYRSFQYSQPKALFTWQENYKNDADRMSFFRLLGSPQLKYFWLDISREVDNDVDRYWFVTNDGKCVDVAKTVNKKGKYTLANCIDDNGNYYKYTSEPAGGKKYKYFLEKYNLATEQTPGYRMEVPQLDYVAVCMSRDGRYAYIYDPNKPEDNYLYDVKSGKQICTLEVPSARQRKIKIDPVKADDFYCKKTRFSADGKKLYTIWIRNYSFSKADYSSLYSSSTTAYGSNIYLTTFRLD